MSEGYNCILVIVDLFSKYAHFLSLRHPFTAATVAKLFISQVYRLHGMPSALVSDRDKIFTSALWRELFKLAKVELHMSMAYHPQSDGQPSGSISVWKPSCAAMFMLVPSSGISGLI